MRHAAICLLLFSFLIPASSWAAEKAGPGMLIPEPVYDAGSVDQGTRIQHDFIVKNTGDAELRIINVDPG